MFSIVRDVVPDDSLLRTYRGGTRPERWRESGDCFSISVDRGISLADFVHAFYASPVFRIERLILGLLGSPSTDVQARQLADGTGISFAVWRVGERSATQLLMCDCYGQTRSWFRVVPLSGGRTLLQFGSAVASWSGLEATPRARGFLYRLLLKFHVLYSQILLHAARRRLMRSWKNV
jgi:hypothetical protein